MNSTDALLWGIAAFVVALANLDPHWLDRVRLDFSALCRRTFADLILFTVTAVELALLVVLTPTFTISDWVYVLQHVLVLGIALTRRPPAMRDSSLASNVAVVVAYSYPYAQVLYLRWVPGYAISPTIALVVVTFAAGLSLASLLALGRRFGVRPALRGLATTGPYQVVRHPMYLSYVIADVGYNLQEWNSGTLVLVTVGWMSLLYRIRAEERILSQHAGWRAYADAVRHRLLPCCW